MNLLRNIKELAIFTLELQSKNDSLSSLQNYLKQRVEGDFH